MAVNCQVSGAVPFPEMLQVLLPVLKALAVHSEAAGMKLVVVSEIVSEVSDITSGERGKVRRFMSLSGEKRVIHESIFLPQEIVALGHFPWVGRRGGRVAVLQV